MQRSDMAIAVDWDPKPKCSQTKLFSQPKGGNSYSARYRKVQVGKDQEKAQTAKDSHSKNPRWEKKQTNNQVPIP